MSRAALIAVVALLASAAPAGGQGGFAVSVGDDAKLLRQTTMPVRIDGALTVDFRSDPATCEAVGRCGLSGTVSWRPPRRGTLFVVESRGRKGRRTDAYLFAEDLGFGRDAPLRTVSRVQRTGATGDGLCADGNSDSQALGFDGTGDALDLGLTVGDETPPLLSTRCAGPLLTDLRGVLPSQRLAVSALRRGRRDVDLRRDGAFTAAGLTGNAHSDLVLHLGAGKTERADRPSGRIRETRRRVLEVSYRVERASGGVGVAIAGLPDASACGALDACGLTGTASLAPRLRGGTISFYAQAPIARPLRDLRAALGLAPGGRPKGIEVLGSGLVEDRGEATMTIGRPGETTCTDRAGLAETALLFAIAGNRARFTYSAFGSGSNGLRTRCPGPPLGASIATGSTSLSAFRARRVTLRLRSGVARHGDGYTTRTTPDLKIVMRRTRVRQQVVRLPQLP